jgi:hypothetical protein
MSDAARRRTVGTFRSVLLHARRIEAGACRFSNNPRWSAGLLTGRRQRAINFRILVTVARQQRILAGLVD